jgi:hypothetical protein
VSENTERGEREREREREILRTQRKNVTQERINVRTGEVYDLYIWTYIVFG